MVRVQVAVITDDQFFAECLLRLLRDEPAVQASALPRLALPAPGEIEYDIAVLDARMVGALLLAASHRREERPSVIFVEAPDNDEWPADALSAGARGVLTRAARAEDLLNAIRVVHCGGLWARSAWLGAQVRRTPAAPPFEFAGLHARLSRREREVCEGAARGIGNKQLADRLAISEATVKAHLTHIYQKLGITKRSELAAIYHGLLALPADLELFPDPDDRRTTKVE
jgi:DNA-binding NarL/FixJ family response regulator